MKACRSSEQGVTLLELLIAVALLSLLTLGMFMAMQLGLSAFTRADDKLMTNRRAVGAQRIMQSELEGLMPVMGVCGAPGGGAAVKLPFFQGQAQTMRLVSTFSLQQGWRGQPQILEMVVIPGETAGVRLVVNEIPYSGPWGTKQVCTARAEGGPPLFAPVQPGPRSFVLADKLAYCRFTYLTPPPQSNPNLPGSWTPTWGVLGWPLAVRVEMAPLEADPSRVQPITISAPIYVHRSLEFPYADL